jgi:hypothetical protein
VFIAGSPRRWSRRARGLACMIPGSGVVKGGRQRGSTFVEEAELVAQQRGVGRSGLAGQLDQALDAGALVFLDDVLNLRHGLGRLDGGIAEGASAHPPVR